MKMSRHRLNFLIPLLVIVLLSQCKAGKTSKEDKAGTVLSVARSYIGTPYKWGGTSKSGMDCSGLVCTSYKAVGIELPRTVVDQSKLGKDVDIASLKKGDLLIFRIRRKKQGKVWHTGIVQEVVNKETILFVHASSSKGVTVSNLMSDYYQKWFRKARRIL